MKRTYQDTGLFHHTVRVGKNRTPFRMSKFRTMKRGAQTEQKTVFGDALPGGRRFRKKDPRITRLGKVLRTTHLDELPQVLNLLKGDLHLVGMRPLPRSEFRKLPEDIRKMYSEIGPGLMGIEYACRPFPPTDEQIFAEFRRFYLLWNVNPEKATRRYALRIIANKTFHGALSR